MHNWMFGAICIDGAFGAAIAAIVLYFLVARGHERLRPLARLSYVLLAQGVVWAAVHLMYLVLHHRYEVSYVAEYSSTDLKLYYLISSFWGGQQGTFFLWAIYTCVLGLVFLSRAPRRFEAPVMMVLALIELFLTTLLMFASPFQLHKPGEIPGDGQGLNVLLQNHWMVIHPPIMFLGFSSLAIPFAIGVTALVRKEYDDWLAVAWPWALFAWCALGTGLFMGGYWAYTVLGWGGFWGWDNVENASLIPWLATTALIHGILLQRARGSMKRANMLFALSPYVLVLFGSFLTRSGILADFSVHSFAAPDRIIYYLLLAFVCTFFIGATGLLVSRVRGIPSAPAFDHEASRGFFFVIGGWVIYACSLFVLVGTSWPLISKFWKHPSNPNQTFYDHYLYPVAILLCVMMAITPFLKWHGRPTEATPRVLGGCLAGALVLALALTLFNAGFYRQSLQAPVDSIVRSNPSAYMTPQPSGVLLNGRTSAQGAVTTGAQVLRAGGDTFAVPAVPRAFSDAYSGALHMKNGMAYPVFAFAALFCILANGFMVWRITGVTRRSWLPAGGFVTHVGVGVLLVGIVTSLNYGGDATLNLNPGSASQGPGQSIRYEHGQPIEAYGHTFTFKGIDFLKDSDTAEMMVEVRTGDHTDIGRPRLTHARDGGMVHFPAIFKFWNEDLYLSPVKIPGMGLDLGFHAVVEVAKDGRTTTLMPGMAFTDDGPRQTDMPKVPGSDQQLTLMNITTPTKDAPDRPNTVDLALAQEGRFNAGATIHLAQGESGAVGGYTIRYVKPQPDAGAKEMFAERSLAQVQISTKPLINLVWLGTFLIISGGALAARRRTIQARRASESSDD